MIKYGVDWNDCEMDVERKIIRAGAGDTGKFKLRGQIVEAQGMFHHFKELVTILWPDDDHHRWSDLELKTIIEERITVIQGPRDSGKTRTAAKYVLCAYWLWPDETLVVMTSTGGRELELRIWGDIKSLFTRAKARWPQLEGKIVNAKTGLFTDDLSSRGEDRDMRKGMIGVPLMSNEGEYMGQALKNFAGIKQKRRILLGDELQFIPCDYLTVLDSMNKNEFKAIMLGNPIGGNGKALDKVAEPVGGWGSLGEVTKTRTWRNKWDGVTIQFVGTDSPNFDKETLNKFPYLIDQMDIDRVSKRPGGKDSLEWWSLIMGVRKLGMVSKRVLTIEQIENCGGFNECIWDSPPEGRLYAVDAGFGGDPCVATYCEWGKEVGGVNVLRFVEQKVIPILVSAKETPEDQIATYVQRDCLSLGVPDSNVFIEAGMRATLMVSFGRIMGSGVNAINFGGNASDRPVSNDFFIEDLVTKQRRLKRCNEHYSKFVTELWFSVAMLVESGQARNFPRTAAEEFAQREWEQVYGDRHEMETKDEYKKRNSGHSPNYGDSAAIAVEGARRLGFVIERVRAPAPGAYNYWTERARREGLLPLEFDEDGTQKETDWMSEAQDEYLQKVKRNEMKYQ